MAERPDPQSFTYRAGESFTLSFSTSGVVTDWSVRFYARPANRPSLSDVISTEDSPATATAAVTAPQTIEVTVDDEATVNLRGDYEYACWAEDTNGDKSEIAWGYLTFEPGVGS